MKLHRPCVLCGTEDPAAFINGHSYICHGCRPAYELKRTGRACFRCLRFQADTRFPVIGTNKQYQRRSAYCLGCIDEIGHAIAAGARFSTYAREFHMARSTVRKLYDFWRRWHPEAHPLTTWTRTRLNSRGQMVRCCTKCSRSLVVKDENFYVAHPDLPLTSPHRWDYSCRRCRGEAARAYVRDKRLQHDPAFYAKARETQRRWVAKNPDKAKEIAARHRERKRNGEVIPLSERRTHDAEHPRVERRAFLAWIEETLPKYPGVTEFADLIGIPPRTLLRLRSDGGRWIELDTVDRALQREGGPTTLRDLYPHLYQEAEEAA